MFLQLEFKVVTPDGVYRTVNACQNKDLFFALRGGMSSVSLLISHFLDCLPFLQVAAEHLASYSKAPFLRLHV